jgi:hypothetical protein
LRRRGPVSQLGGEEKEARGERGTQSWNEMRDKRIKKKTLIAVVAFELTCCYPSISIVL